jgi:hypothetical protein
MNNNVIGSEQGIDQGVKNNNNVFCIRCNFITPSAHTE